MISCGTLQYFLFLSVYFCMFFSIYFCLLFCALAIPAWVIQMLRCKLQKTFARQFWGEMQIRFLVAGTSQTISAGFKEMAWNDQVAGTPPIRVTADVIPVKEESTLPAWVSLSLSLSPAVQKSGRKPHIGEPTSTHGKCKWICWPFSCTFFYCIYSWTNLSKGCAWLVFAMPLWNYAWHAQGQGEWPPYAKTWVWLPDEVELSSLQLLQMALMAKDAALHRHSGAWKT